MLNNDIIIDFICQHFYVTSLQQRVGGCWGSRSDTSPGVSPPSNAVCSVHIGVAIFLDLNVPVFKRLKTWAFQWLKTHWLQPVFGGFLSPTGLIRNRPGSSGAAEGAGLRVRPGSRAVAGRCPGSECRAPDHQSPDPGPGTGLRLSQQFLPSPMRALSLPNWQPFLCSPWNGKNWDQAAWKTV